MTLKRWFRQILGCLVIFFTGTAGFAQTLGDYRSVNDGNWTTLATWERLNSTGPDVWAVPTGVQGYPGQFGIPDVVTIRSGDDITLNVTIILNDLSLGGNTGISFDNTSLIASAASGNPSLTLGGDLTATAGLISTTTISFGGSGNLTISGNSNIGGGSLLGAALNFSSTGTLTTSGSVTVQPLLSSVTISGGSLVMSGNLSIGALVSSVTFSTAGNITIAGTTTIGVGSSLLDNNNTGTSIFGGLVTNNTGTWTSTAVTTESRMVFRGGVANNNGSFNGGGATFNTNNQSISGNSAITFNNNVAITGVIVNCSNSSDLTISGTTTLATSGGFTDSNNAGITILAGNVNIGVGTAFTSTAVNSTANMIFRGGISQAGTFNAGGATFSVSNQSITGNAGLSFSGNILINGIVVTNSNTSNFFVGGTTTLTNGGFTDSNNSAATTFVGNVNLTGTSVFVSTVVTTNPNMVFRGGITNNGGTFSAGAGTFDTNNQSLAGTATISFANFVNVDGVTVTNSNSASVSLTRSASAVPTLIGNGTWTQDVNSTLNYSGSSINVNTFNASNSGNTVNYNVSNYGQTIRNVTYHHLTLSGIGNQTKTLSANTTVNGNLSIQNTAIFSVSTFTLSVAGNWTNSSTNADPFVQGTQTVTFNGTAAQTITNTGDAQGTEFNNLTINNTFGTAPQITLNNATIVRGALTLTQGIVATSTSALLTLVDNATTNGGDADSYVDGPIRKIGNDAFVFPTGDGTIWARIGISTPATATTEFTVF